MHQVDEHDVGVLLVLHQWVLLPPRAVVNRCAQLVEIVEVILPLFIEHVEHHEGQQPAPKALARFIRDRVQTGEFRLEGQSAGVARCRLRDIQRRGLHVGRELWHLQHVVHEQVLLHVREVPLFGTIERGQRLLDPPLHTAVDHLQRLRLELLAAVKRERPQRVDHLALLVHHVVVLEQSLPRLEVLQLDPLLRLLDGARDERMRQHFAILGAHAIHQFRDAIGPEQAHQVVFE